MDNSIQPDQLVKTEPVYVVGAVVSCKTRHKQDRHTRKVNIPKTDLNERYYFNENEQAFKNIAAREQVRKVLNNLGFKSTYQIISWIHDE